VLLREQLMLRSGVVVTAVPYHLGGKKPGPPP
jgi:hypothetical protein